MCKEKTKNIIELQTIILFTVGVIGIIASAYYAEAMKPISGSFSSAFAAGLTTISISLMGLGVFSFALDTKSWKEYFAERLKEVIIESDYLNTLDQDTLKDIQTRLLKAQFKNQSIDKEGSFLNYFHRHLHKFISEPYREDVSTEVLMKSDGSNSEQFIVTDKVRYVCRASRNSIQKHISWKPDDDEFEKVNSLKITIQYPPHHEFAGTKVEIYSKSAEKLDKDLVDGIKIELEEKYNIDSLIVITEAEYIVKVGKFQYWQMAHPTKNFDITITYPEDHKIQFKTLVLEDVVSQVTVNAGYLKFGYGSWALPQSGLAWLISKA